MSVAVTTLAVLGGFSLVSCTNITTITTPAIKAESLELVNVIKQDLRKNNDDYAEHLPRMGAPRSAYLNFTTKPAAATTASVDRQLPLKHGLHLEDTRRQGSDPLQRRHSRLTNDILSKSGHNANSQIHQKTRAAEPHSLAERLKLHNITKQYPKLKMDNATTNKGKPDKLKTFIERNRGMLQEFLRKRKAKVAMRARASSLESRSSETLRRGAVELPSPDALDMVPALGARVQRLRMKGNFCFRDVMMPEGPKYDSKGKVYVKAYDAKPHSGDYARTVAPALLLPKCCNCCKKSVLGCE